MTLSVDVEADRRARILKRYLGSFSFILFNVLGEVAVAGLAGGEGVRSRLRSIGVSRTDSCILLLRVCGEG